MSASASTRPLLAFLLCASTLSKRTQVDAIAYRTSGLLREFNDSSAGQRGNGTEPPRQGIEVPIPGESHGTSLPSFSWFSVSTLPGCAPGSAWGVPRHPLHLLAHHWAPPGTLPSSYKPEPISNWGNYTPHFQGGRRRLKYDDPWLRDGNSSSVNSTGEDGGGGGSGGSGDRPMDTLPPNSLLFTVGEYTACDAGVAQVYPLLSHETCEQASSLPTISVSSDLGRTWKCRDAAGDSLVARFGSTAVSFQFLVNATDIEESAVGDANITLQQPRSTTGLAFTDCSMLCLIGGLDDVSPQAWNRSLGGSPPWVVVSTPPVWAATNKTTCCRTPACDSWFDGPELPEAVAHATAIQFNNSIIVLGGVQANGLSALFLSTVDAATCTLGPWTRPIANVPVAPRRVGMVVAQTRNSGGELLVGGGLTISSTDNSPLYANLDIWSASDPVDSTSWHMLTPSLPTGDSGINVKLRYMSILRFTVPDSVAATDIMWLYSSRGAYLTKTAVSPPVTINHYQLLYPFPQRNEPQTPGIRSPVVVYDHSIGERPVVFALPAGERREGFEGRLVRGDITRCYDRCPNRSYYSLGCTTGPRDAYCRLCTVCGLGQREIQPCRFAFLGYSDTVCQNCAFCPAGFEVAYKCNETHDTGCRPINGFGATRPQQLLTTADGDLILTVYAIMGCAAGVLAAVPAFHYLRSAGLVGGGTATGGSGKATSSPWPGSHGTDPLRALSLSWPIVASVASLAVHLVLAIAYLKAEPAPLASAATLLVTVLCLNVTANIAMAIRLRRSTGSSTSGSGVGEVVKVVSPPNPLPQKQPHKLRPFFSAKRVIHGATSASAPSSACAAAGSSGTDTPASAVAWAQQRFLSKRTVSRAALLTPSSPLSPTPPSAPAIPFHLLLLSVVHPRSLLILHVLPQWHGMSRTKAVHGVVLRWVGLSTLTIDAAWLLTNLTVLGQQNATQLASPVLLSVVFSTINIVATLSWAASAAARMKTWTILANSAAAAAAAATSGNTLGSAVSASGGAGVVASSSLPTSMTAIGSSQQHLQPTATVVAAQLQPLQRPFAAAAAAVTGASAVEGVLLAPASQHQQQQHPYIADGTAAPGTSAFVRLSQSSSTLQPQQQQQQRNSINLTTLNPVGPAGASAAVAPGAGGGNGVGQLGQATSPSAVTQPQQHQQLYHAHHGQHHHGTPGYHPNPLRNPTTPTAWRPLPINLVSTGIGAGAGTQHHHRTPGDAEASADPVAAPSMVGSAAAAAASAAGIAPPQQQLQQQQRRPMPVLLPPISVRRSGLARRPSLESNGCATAGGDGEGASTGLARHESMESHGGTVGRRGTVGAAAVASAAATAAAAAAVSASVSRVGRALQHDTASIMCLPILADGNSSGGVTAADGGGGGGGRRMAVGAATAGVGAAVDSYHAYLQQQYGGAGSAGAGATNASTVAGVAGGGGGGGYAQLAGLLDHHRHSDHVLHRHSTRRRRGHVESADGVGSNEAFGGSATAHIALEGDDDGVGNGGDDGVSGSGVGGFGSAAAGDDQEQEGSGASSAAAGGGHGASAVGGAGSSAAGGPRQDEDVAEQVIAVARVQQQPLSPRAAGASPAAAAGSAYRPGPSAHVHRGSNVDANSMVANFRIRASADLGTPANTSTVRGEHHGQQQLHHQHHDSPVSLGMPVSTLATSLRSTRSSIGTRR